MPQHAHASSHMLHSVRKTCKFAYSCTIRVYTIACSGILDVKYTLPMHICTVLHKHCAQQCGLQSKGAVGEGASSRDIESRFMCVLDTRASRRPFVLTCSIAVQDEPETFQPCVPWGSRCSMGYGKPEAHTAAAAAAIVRYPSLSVPASL